MLFDIIPYRIDKDLGKAYNEQIALLPEDSHICLRDADTCWLTPDYGTHLRTYIEKNPLAVLTCYTNRISEVSKQLFGMRRSADPNMANHIRIAQKRMNDLYTVTELKSDISGFCLVFPRSLWVQQPFAETGKPLGIDTEWGRRIRAAGVPVLRMNGLYIWHTYRILDNSKKHLDV